MPRRACELGDNEFPASISFVEHFSVLRLRSLSYRYSAKS